MPDDVQNVLPENEQEVHVVKAENPVIFDKVEYVYASYAQFISSSIDFRIALGDRIPPEGKVAPRIGIVMTHEFAKAFLKAMAANVGSMEQSLGILKAVGAESKDTTT